jgi:hypothetical protein
MVVIIDSRGSCRLIYDESLDLNSMGEFSIQRASHVEPTATGAWRADLSPVGGPKLGPFAKRSDALAAETTWLTQNWLPTGSACQA